MSQLDMFGHTPQPIPPHEPPPEFAPFPDQLYKRLNRTLMMAERAERLPWPEPRVAAYEVEQFLACVERLPPDRRGDLAVRFRTQMTRLGWRF